MATATFSVTTAGGCTANFQKAARLRLTYTAGNGTISITKLEGCRTDKQTSNITKKVSANTTYGGTKKDATVTALNFYKNNGWKDLGYSGTSCSGLNGNTTVSIKLTMTSISQGTPTFSGTIDAGSPTPYYWNDINAYNPDKSAQNALKFNLSTSDGGSWTDLTNEPSDFTKRQGTTATISNIRSNLTGAHYSGNNITSSTASSFTWTFDTANWATELYTAWDTYTVAYNANGGTGAPGSQTKTYGQNLTLSSTKPTRANSTGNGYTVTFNANGGSVSPTTKTATNTYSYSFNNWKATNGTTYNPGGTYSANEGTTMTAQWNTTTTRGSITTPTATRSNGTATRTVTFDAATNGGTCPTASLNSTATVTYTANGWYTATSGGTKRCANGGSYTPAATETVYQQWGSTTGSYSAITLPAATKANSSAPSRVVTIDANKGSTTINSRTSNATITYTQSGWWTAASGGTNRGNAGATYTPSATEKIYAQFNSTIGPYSEIVLPTESECTRPNHNLLGFSTKKFGKPMYEPGEHIVPEASMLLYAIWDGEDASIYYKSGGNWYLGKPYYKYNGSWYTIAGGWYKINGRWYPFAGKKAPTAASTNVIESKLDALLNK